jgi:hypothetical protein
MINKGGSELWISGYCLVNTVNYNVDKQVENSLVHLWVIVEDSLLGSPY